MASEGPSRDWGHPWFSAVPLTFLFSWPRFLPSLFPLGHRPSLLHPAPFPRGASLVLLFGDAGPLLGGDTMCGLDTVSPWIPGRRWAWRMVAACVVCKEGKSGGFWDFLPLGAVTLKRCVSEDIQVVQLAALKEGSKEAKVPGPASIWTSRSASPCAVITSPPPARDSGTYRVPSRQPSLPSWGEFSSLSRLCSLGPLIGKKTETPRGGAVCPEPHSTGHRVPFWLLPRNLTAAVCS